MTAASGPVWFEISQGDGGDVLSGPGAVASTEDRYSSFQNLSSFRRRTFNSSDTLIGTVFPALLVAWGFGFGASIPVPFALIADLFGRRSYGSVMGTMMTTSAIFGVVGPVLVGWIFDVRGNYREPFLLIAFSVLIAIPLILTLGKPAEQRS